MSNITETIEAANSMIGRSNLIRVRKALEHKAVSDSNYMDNPKVSMFEAACFVYSCLSDAGLTVVNEEEYRKFEKFEKSQRS